MIGSLLFYGLFPLSRYVTSRLSNAVRESPAMVVDGAVTLSQNTVLLQQLPLGEESESGMRKGSRTMEEDNIFDMKAELGGTDDEGSHEVTEEKHVLALPADEGLDGGEMQKTHVVATENKAEPSECWDDYIVEEVDSSGFFSFQPDATLEEDFGYPAAAKTSDHLHVRHHEKFGEKNPETLDFTVMSYNILAQDLLEAHEELYLHCPLEVLDWNYRCKMLLEEIQESLPDILCLQEVQENHYYEQLFPALTRLGYECVFKRRTGNKTDGCATCYQCGRFSKVSASPLELYRPETGLLDRHNVAVVLLLEPTPPPEQKSPLLCVANTHLLFNPWRGDVKLAQLGLLLAEVDRMFKSCADEGRRCDIVLCGDLNAVPQSPLCRLITTGNLYMKDLPMWLVSCQEDLSHQLHSYRLMSPWPISLGITNDCQYVRADQTRKAPSVEADPCRHSEGGRIQYSHEFLLQLRSCPLSSIRPPDLPIIPGVTDATQVTATPFKAVSSDCCSRYSSGGHRRTPRISQSFTISHRFDLESVYKHVLPGSGAAEVTTLHSQAGATVDYIFFSPRRTCSTDGDSLRGGLTLLSCLSLPSEDVLWSLRGLPNHMFPSDHLSLLAKFQMDLSAP